MGKRRKVILAEIILLCNIFLFYGCASIIDGRRQELTFQSTPEGATVTVAGRIIGRTPITATLLKETNQAVEFKKDGYNPVTMQLTTHLDGWFWGNILIGGLIGSTTDGISGAVHEYSPSQYYVTLQPVNVSNLQFSGDYNKVKIKDFIVGSYRNLSMDIVAGKGDYLNSLIDLLKIPPEKRPDAIQNMQKILKQSSNILDFSDRVISEYMK
jgi:hypothetical protein